MARLRPAESVSEAIRVVAVMMASSTITAPKARGIDLIETMIVDGDDLQILADAIEDKAKEQPAYLSKAYSMDAQNVRNSSSVLLIGVIGDPPKSEEPMNCGACGYKTCEQLLAVRGRKGKEPGGPICTFQAINLGIALGSAAKLASDLNVDNRIMYTIGDGAKKLRLLDSDIILGIPLSVTGKNIYFDRH